MLTPEEWQILGLSAKVAGVSLVVLLVPAIATAWVLARFRFPGKVVVDALVHLPLVLPPVVTGYLLLLLLGRRGVVGSWLHGLGIDLAFTWVGAVIAAAVMAFPLMVRSVRLAIEAVDPRLESAAMTLGAGRLRALATITLPLALPGICTGLVLAFARGLGEFGATITLAGNIPGVSRTLPVAIHTALQTPEGDAQALRLALISVAIAVAALVIGEIIQQRALRRRGHAAGQDAGEANR